MTGSRASATNYQDFWWNAQESGWGLNVLHEGSVLFATLFSYDASGADMWLVASRLDKQADGSFSGPLTRMTGSWFGSSNWGVAAPHETGAMTLRFTSGDNGTLSYRVDTVTVTESIQRHVFGSSVPLCR